MASTEQQIETVSGWLNATLAGMLDYPNDIALEAAIPRLDAVEFRLQVNPLDRAKVIGRSGRNIRALRLLLHCMGRKAKMYFELVLDEEPKEHDLQKAIRELRPATEEELKAQRENIGKSYTPGARQTRMIRYDER